MVKSLNWVPIFVCVVIQIIYGENTNILAATKKLTPKGVARLESRAARHAAKAAEYDAKAARERRLQSECLRALADAQSHSDLASGKLKRIQDCTNDEIMTAVIGTRVSTTVMKDGVETVGAIFECKIKWDHNAPFWQEINLDENGGEIPGLIWSTVFRRTYVHHYLDGDVREGKSAEELCNELGGRLATKAEYMALIAKFDRLPNGIPTADLGKIEYERLLGRSTGRSWIAFGHEGDRNHPYVFGDAIGQLTTDGGIRDRNSVRCVFPASSDVFLNP